MPSHWLAPESKMNKKGELALWVLFYLYLQYNTINKAVYVYDYMMCVVVRIFSIVSREWKGKIHPPPSIFHAARSSHLAWPSVYATCTVLTDQYTTIWKTNRSIRRWRRWETNSQPPSFHFQSDAYHMCMQSHYMRSVNIRVLFLVGDFSIFFGFLYSN